MGCTCDEASGSQECLEGSGGDMLQVNPSEDFLCLFAGGCVHSPISSSHCISVNIASEVNSQLGADPKVI